MIHFKDISIKTIVGGFITGLIIQLHSNKDILINSGLFKCVIDNLMKILLTSLFSILVFYSIILINKAFNNKLSNNTNNCDIENFFFSFTILLGYLFFQPSEILFISLFLAIPVVFFFVSKGHFIKKTIKSQTIKNVAWLYLFIFLYQCSYNVIQIIYSKPANYLFYTEQIIALLIYLIIPLLFPRIIKIYTVFILLLFFISNLITNTYILLYGSDFTPSSYYAIWDTNTTEAFDFFKQYITFNIIAVNIILLSILVLPFVIIKKQLNDISIQKRLLLISTILGLAFLTDYSELNLPNRFLTSYKTYKKELKEVQKQIEFRKNNPLKEQAAIHCDRNKEVPIIVLVIGESASKYHQSLYEYKRNTNPLLSSIKNDLFVFDSIISPNAHTNPVLSKALTFANNENMEPLYSKRNIIEYMNCAGYKTFWLSNQPFAENFSTIATSIAVQAKSYIFTNSNLDDYQNSNLYYDELLFKPYKIALKDNAPKKFIVLHLMGSHSDKVKRFPPKFQKFNDWKDIPSKPYNTDGVKDVINAHDNSVLYNDWILYTLIKELKATNTNSVLLYFSDHGEEIFDYRNFWGHSEGNASIYMLDIPFFLWTSEKYQKTHTDRFNFLSQCIHRKFQTDDAIHSIIDLSECKSLDYDSTRSVFSPYFKCRKRTIEGKDYDSMITNHKKSITD